MSVDRLKRRKLTPNLFFCCLAATPIVLSNELERLVRRGSIAQQVALRAKIILRTRVGAGRGKISRGLEKLQLGIAKEKSRLNP